MKTRTNQLQIDRLEERFRKSEPKLLMNQSRYSCAITIAHDNENTITRNVRRFYAIINYTRGSLHENNYDNAI